MTQQEWIKEARNGLDKLANIVHRFCGLPAEVEFRHSMELGDAIKAGQFLQDAWEAAPDKAWIHEIPGWGLLCDLASEWCFGDIQEVNP